MLKNLSFQALPSKLKVRFIHCVNFCLMYFIISDRFSFLFGRISMWKWVSISTPKRRRTKTPWLVSKTRTCKNKLPHTHRRNQAKSYSPRIDSSTKIIRLRWWSWHVKRGDVWKNSKVFSSIFLFLVLKAKSYKQLLQFRLPNM